MGKTRFRVYAALVFALFSSIMLPLSLASCNGNGGGSDSYGELYSLGGGGGSGSSGQAQSGGDISAIDILNYSNADDMETVVAILLGGGGGGTDETRTQTVTLSADDIGLPSGGTATLTISGNGVDYTATATADADGNVTFEIPAITSGTEITASLAVKNASGVLLYSGSQTELLTGENFTIDITLHRQYQPHVTVGSKAAPDAVGDIVFSDGSASPYTDFATTPMTDAQKAAAVAVIFDAASKKGVGLNVGTGKWCDEGTIAYSVRTYATSFDNGKANTEQIAGLSDYSDNYPAFWFCSSYSVPGYTSGWYLPARNELLSLRENKTEVEKAFISLGAASPFVLEQMYFSSSQADSDASLDYGSFVKLLYDTSDPLAYGGYGYTTKRTACNVVAVRTFD